MTQGGKRIFCVEGSFDITTQAEAWRLHITSAPEPFASAVKSGYEDQYIIGREYWGFIDDLRLKDW